MANKAYGNRDVEKGPVNPSESNLSDSAAPSRTLTRTMTTFRPKDSVLADRGYNSSWGNSAGEDDDFYETPGTAWLGRKVDKAKGMGMAARWAMNIIPLALILAIPLALFATVYRDVHADTVRLLGLFVWLETMWGVLWVLKFLVLGLPFVYNFLVTFGNAKLRRHAPIVQELENSVTFLLWTIVGEATVTQICMHFRTSGTAANDKPEWLKIFARVWLATIAVAGMILVEKVIIKIISITYKRKQFEGQRTLLKTRIKRLAILYKVSLKIFPINNRDNPEVIQEVDLALTTGGKEAGNVTTAVFADVLTGLHSFGNIFNRMGQDIGGLDFVQHGKPGTMVLQALDKELTCKALGKRIFHSLVCGPGKSSITKRNIQMVFERIAPEHACLVGGIFHMFDNDNNGDIEEEEMMAAVTTIGSKLKSLDHSINDVDSAVYVLDRFLQVIVIIGTALVYAAFFSSGFSQYLATIGTQVAAISFAISQTVQEFLGSCIFLFIKHAYDVDDRVNIKGEKLIVNKISLLHTVFTRLENGQRVQIPNIALNDDWIENITRSNDMRELIDVDISSDTSISDINLLRDEIAKKILTHFRRDFWTDVSVELLEVGDMSKLQLRVEARHKSNWADETRRRDRRNKLMTAILTSIRAIPIQSPGGEGQPLGALANPSFSVSVTEEQAEDAKRQWMEEKKARRLVPVPEVDAPGLFIGQGVSSGVNFPSSRTASVAERGRMG